MTDAPSQKPRLLRVGRVITAAFKYLWKDARRLIIVAWFACVLASATRLLMEWLVFPWPPKIPDWMSSDYFDPPTWLMAFALTPWLAMGWAFVLDEMEWDEGRRGTVRTPAGELAWLRFELSGPVLIAAAILAAVNAFDALTRFAHGGIVDAIVASSDASDLVVTVSAALLTAVRVLIVVAVLVWCYLLAGMVLRDGTFSVGRLHTIMRGNWHRVIAIFLVLSIILRGIYQLIEPAANRLIARLTDSLEWTVQAALIRFVVDFPFQMLWIVSWAIIVGVVLHTLDPRPDGRTDIPA